jgi:hypothetical protein
MTREQIQEILKPIDELWKKSQHTATEFDSVPASTWHGYGWRKDQTGLVVSPFVEKQQDLGPIQDEFTEKLPKKVKVEGLVLPAFRQLRTGNQRELLDPLQPGNVVFVSDCPHACTGTIGAFLIDGAQSIWLLSNHHVLGECSSPNVIGAHAFPIGTEVRAVPVKDTGNTVDAALVKIMDTSAINPEFEGMRRLANPRTAALPRLRRLEPVKKLGNATDLTDGVLVLHCQTVKVIGCTDGKEREFQDQLAFISKKPDQRFADEGDSGALIVAGTRPIGLLFAQTDPPTPETQNEQSFQAPIFLANRWDLVIQELSKAIPKPIRLMLDKRMAATG